MPIVAIACEHMGCRGQGRLPPRRLGGLHHTLPQEPDVCPSIALTLEQLQAVDMALDRTIAPGQGESRCDRREILLQALGKACERLNPARRCLGHPRLQGVAPALPVAYLGPADKYGGPLLCRLRGVNQSVIRTQSVFSTPRAILLAYI